MNKTIDKIDSEIIRVLQENGRMPNTEIAKKVGISEATVRNRLQRLIEGEFIQIVAIGNPFKLGFGILGNLKITTNSKKIDHVVNELKKLNEIWYIAVTTGVTDLDVEFTVRSLDDFYALLFNKINNIDGVIRTETSFVLKRYIKMRYDWRTAEGEEGGHK